MSLPYNRDLTPYARKLRREATRQENHLWYDFLNTLPVRFQRQKPIGEYIVDFYCHKCKLVIEIDGSQHFDDAAKAYEQRREQYLNSIGLTVLHFTNIDIDCNFAVVCQYIDNILRKLITQ